MTAIHQSKRDYAYKHNGKGFTRNGKFVGDTLENVLLSDGGLCKIEGGAGRVILKNVGSVGSVYGGGRYFLITANKPVKYLQWDNSGIPDVWINASSGTKKGERPGEAAFRIMGKAKTAIIVGVNIRAGTWIDDKGKKDWWKQGVQIRDIEHIEFHGRKDCGKIIGPIELGRQKDPSGKDQKVGTIKFFGYGFTHLPTVSVKGSVGKQEYRGCYYIDENGKKISKKFPNTAG